MSVCLYVWEYVSIATIVPPPYQQHYPSLQKEVI